MADAVPMIQTCAEHQTGIIPSLPSWAFAHEDLTWYTDHEHERLPDPDITAHVPEAWVAADIHVPADIPSSSTYADAE